MPKPRKARLRKRLQHPERLPLVEVVWTDSCTPNSEWMSEERFASWVAARFVTIRSVGYLVDDRKEGLTLVQSFGAEAWMHPLQIPRGCVVEVRTMKKKGKRKGK